MSDIRRSLMCLVVFEHHSDGLLSKVSAFYASAFHVTNTRRMDGGFLEAKAKKKKPPVIHDAVIMSSLIGLPTSYIGNVGCCHPETTVHVEHLRMNMMGNNHLAYNGMLWVCRVMRCVTSSLQHLRLDLGMNPQLSTKQWQRLGRTLGVLLSKPQDVTMLPFDPRVVST